MSSPILEYYQGITDGSITAGRFIKLVYGKIVSDLERKEYSYDAKKANRAIRFIEQFCHHHEGALAPQRLTLELWQKALIASIFGLVDEDGARHFRECFVVVSRKNGKTLLASAIAQYMAFLDGEYGARVYFTAPKLEQASLCYDAFYQSIRHEPALEKMAKKRRTDIYIEELNTTVKPLAFNAKKSDGLNVSLGVCDECAAWPGPQGLKFYEVLKSSMGARKQPLLLTITTAGYENEGIYDELMVRATRYLLGGSKETRLLPFLYTIDDPEKWNDINELQKSNPNLGVSVSVDYLLEEIAIAEGSFSKKAEFLTKYCCLKQNSSQSWLQATDIERASGEPLHLEDYREDYAIVGLDLSRTTDLTAAVAIIQRDGVLNIFAQFYLPGERIEEASLRDGLPYQKYIERGILVPSGENFVDYRDAYRWIVSLVERYHIYPLRVMYDRYSAQYLIQDLEGYGFQCDDCFQGLNMTPGIREFEGLLKDGKVRIGDNDLLKVHLLNAALKLDNQTARCKLIKQTANDHIDGVAAIIDAMIGRQKWWAEIGAQLQNDRRR